LIGLADLADPTILQPSEGEEGEQGGADEEIDLFIAEPHSATLIVTGNFGGIQREGGI
jgi:hypothetical protein